MAKRCLTLAIIAVLSLGQAVFADVSLPITAVSFPKDVIPVEAGRIEFWAKLSGFSGAIDVGGGEPHFFQIYDGSSAFHAGFNANDGVANGGLTGVGGFNFHTGTGFFGSWTYEDIFGAGHVDEWHQYVFQWNKDGIPGVADGQQKVALFLDGVLNSGSWHGVTPGTPGTFPPLVGGSLNLITTGGAPLVSPGEVAIDELKVYDGDNNLVLWNTLGSIDEVEQSAVGLNGSFNGGGGAHFVPGVSGNAVMATPVVAIGPSTDTTPPFTSGHSPAPVATGVAANTNIVVHVRDLGVGVDSASLAMTVEGVAVLPAVTGTPADFTLTYDPPADFALSQVVEVTVHAKDLADNTMPTDAYSFTTKATHEVSATVSTVIHLFDHTPVPCFDSRCNSEQVAPTGSVVHDQAAVTSADPANTPTGSVTFAFYVGNLNCSIRPTSLENVALTSSGGLATAESSNTVPLAAGHYSYKAIYFPDAAAKDLGFKTTPAKCEQLGVLEQGPVLSVNPSAGSGQCCTNMTEITITGTGFKDGTIATVWVDTNNDGKRDDGESDLVTTVVGSDDAFHATITVEVPPFVCGLNYIMAVDGRSNVPERSASFDLECIHEPWPW